MSPYRLPFSACFTVSSLPEPQASFLYIATVAQARVFTGGADLYTDEEHRERPQIPRPQLCKADHMLPMWQRAGGHHTTGLLSHHLWALPLNPSNNAAVLAAITSEYGHRLSCVLYLHIASSWLIWLMQLIPYCANYFFWQGYQCKRCLLDCHEGCLSSMPSCCAHKKGKRTSKADQQRPISMFANAANKHLQSGATRKTPLTRDGKVTSKPLPQDGDYISELDPTYITALPQSPAQPARHKTKRLGSALNLAKKPADHAQGDASEEEEMTGFRTTPDVVNSSDDEGGAVNSSDDEVNSSDGEVNSSDDGGAVNSSDEDDGSDDQAADGTSIGGGFVDRGGFSAEPRQRQSKSAAPEGHSKSFRIRLNRSQFVTGKTNAIKLKDFSVLDKEFDDIPQNRVNIMHMPKLTEWKNRYMNILPNSNTRVILPQLGDDETSTYINANWIPGIGGEEKAYIACQGPMPETVLDFWRMVWQTNCPVIVMNTGLIEKGDVVKCERYWPESPGGFPMVIAAEEEFSIVSKSEDKSRPQFVKTTLEVSHRGERREIIHLWWTDWPDKGVPQTANGIGHYIDEARAARSQGTGPVVIHCSAGIGRTGCFLSIDMCMQQFDKLKKMDILGCVCGLRRSRGMTVQTSPQYRYIHEVLQRYMEGKLYEVEPEPDKVKEEPRPPSLDLSENGDTGKQFRRNSRPLSCILSRKDSAMKMSRRMKQIRRRSTSESLSSESSVNVSVGSESSTSPSINRSNSRRGSSELVALENQVEVKTNGGLIPHGNHAYRYKTFVKPTQCDVCHSMLAGLALQGLRCSKCKTNVHNTCIPACSEKCSTVSKIRTDPSGLPNWPPKKGQMKRGGSKLAGLGATISE